MTTYCVLFQKLVKTQNRGKMSINRGGESGFNFD